MCLALLAMSSWKGIRRALASRKGCAGHIAGPGGSESPPSRRRVDLRFR
jgi:hypothetical protein